MKRFASLVLVFVFVCTAVFAAGYAETAAKADPSSLTYWTEESVARKEIVAFMQAITDPASPDFIPVENRIAVFDFDGTLFCETDPDYFDHMLLAYRVLQDASYREKASDFEKEVAEKIMTLSQTSSLRGQ